MIGAWTVSGARFVATKECKERRYPAGSPIAPDPLAGSYLALYWILAGKLDEWMRWGTDQVNWLHANGRMFLERDHVHTLMYELADERAAAPTESRPSSPSTGATRDWSRRSARSPTGTPSTRSSPGSPARECPADLVLTFTPRPLFDDAPGDVPRDTVGNRFLQLAFVTDDPLDAFDERFTGLGDDLATSGLGSIVFASPFLATVPGTDTYTDRLR